MRRLITLACVLMLAGCVRTPMRAHIVLPSLHLPPVALGHTLAEQQQLVFHFGRESREMTALLEVDAVALRLAVEALGQTGVRLHWDGRNLDERRAAWLPPQVRGARVLDDIQFVLWPADAIRAALPSGWRLETTATQRRLLSGDTAWLSARYDATGVELENAAEGYRLDIQSHAIGSTP